MNCRFCNNKVVNDFADLGFSPPSNSFLGKEQLNQSETFYPLKVQVCNSCFLVQVDEYAKHDEIFDKDYIYFSSYSSSWLEHARNYTDMMIKRFNFNHESNVFEIASNDGYLLQYFKEKNINVLGIEPTSNTADVAISKGIETLVRFFGKKLALELQKNNRYADLILGNNVLAHVPDINDFVSGLPLVLKKEGIITFEFPHLMELMLNNQFDTIYHEHFSYLSLFSVQIIFKKHNLKIFDVDQIKTHGGSLRIYATHSNNSEHSISSNVSILLNEELKFGLNSIKKYNTFQKFTELVKDNFLSFLLKAKRDDKKVIGYGAAAKGVTLLNFCGVRKDLIQFIVDKSPHKIDKYIPGVHIPVLSEKEISNYKPDYIVILPWNIKDEIIQQLKYVRDWNCKFVVAIPKIKIL